VISVPRAHYKTTVATEGLRGNIHGRDAARARPMLKYLVPRIALADLPPIVGVAMVGALLAGSYGVVHDQITYSVSSEYFTNLKFKQFSYADAGLGDRVFVATIGFLATWWVGFIIAWFLARRMIPNQPRMHAYRQILRAFGIVFSCGLMFGIGGFAFGLWRGPDADYSSWAWAFRQYSITDAWSFVRVAYIHNASYVGGLVGLVAALVTIRPRDAITASACAGPGRRGDDR